MTEGVQPHERLNAFIADDPIYKWLDLQDLWGEGNVSGNLGSYLSTDKLYRRCEHPRCKTGRPFNRMPGEGMYGTAFHQEPGLSSEQMHDAAWLAAGPVHSLTFLCTGCNSSVFQCWIEAHPQNRHTGRQRVRKIGQVPPYEISPSEDLLDALGDDADLYKKALACLSQSYGVAACAYLRRILENLTVRLAKESGEGGELGTVPEERDMETTIRLANEALPDSVKIPGRNPLSIVYGRLSVSLHRKDDQECAEIAEKAKRQLELIFTRIRDERRQRRQRREYEDVMKELESGPS